MVNLIDKNLRYTTLKKCYSKSLKECFGYLTTENILLLNVNKSSYIDLQELQRNAFDILCEMFLP